MAQWLKTFATLPEQQYNPQHPHGGLKPSITPVLRGLTLSSGLHGHQACT